VPGREEAPCIGEAAEDAFVRSVAKGLEVLRGGLGLSLPQRVGKPLAEHLFERLLLKFALVVGFVVTHVRLLLAQPNAGVHARRGRAAPEASRETPCWAAVVREN
jgi:hypothetical protein